MHALYSFVSMELQLICLESEHHLMNFSLFSERGGGGAGAGTHEPVGGYVSRTYQGHQEAARQTLRLREFAEQDAQHQCEGPKPS